MQPTGEVVAVITDRGAIEFLGKPFAMGALLDAARNLEGIVRGQVLSPHKPEAQGEPLGDIDIE